MKKVFKWIGILLLVLLGAAIAAYGAMVYTVKQRQKIVYEVPKETIQFRHDTEAVARGAYLYHIVMQCTECHGENLGGQVIQDDYLTGTFVVPNLTTGKGGLPADLSDEDLLRIIRHGVHKDGTSVLLMPSNAFNMLGDADTAALIAYIRSAPPVDNELPPVRFGPMGYFYIFQMSELLPASVIDHQAKRPPDPVPGVTLEYGRYMGAACRFCHGENMAGGPAPGQGLNLTPGGDLASWSEEDFLNTVRTGVSPSGRKLDPELMPWETLGKMTDDDLKAIWLYLKDLPPVQNPTPTP